MQDRMLQDIIDYDEAKQQIEKGESLIPGEVTFKIIDGENPIKVWRQYLDISSQQLTTAVGISKYQLSQLESGYQNGTTEVLTAIATTLNISLDEIS